MKKVKVCHFLASMRCIFKGLNATTVASTLPDLSKLNLSKFIEEIAQAIAETKMKVSDIGPVVDFCVELALRYGDFSNFYIVSSSASFPETLLSELKKNLPLKKVDKVTNPAKLRIDFRFLCELVACGVLGKDGLQVLFLNCGIKHIYYSVLEL